MGFRLSGGGGGGTSLPVTSFESWWTRVIINKSAAARRGKYTSQLWQRKDAQETLLKSNKPKVLSYLPCFVGGLNIMIAEIQIK